MKIGAEDTQLIIVMDWVRFNNLDYIWHCANERVVSPQGGAILKRKGVLAGVSDLIIMTPRNGFHGMFIEMKVGVGKLSPAQAKFLEIMNREGYLAVVRYGADETIKTIKEYLGLN